MKFTFGRLKEHLDTDQSLAAITDRLSMLGLEVEQIDEAEEGTKSERLATRNIFEKRLLARDTLDLSEFSGNHEFGFVRVA